MRVALRTLDLITFDFPPSKLQFSSMEKKRVRRRERMQQCCLVESCLHVVYSNNVSLYGTMHTDSTSQALEAGIMESVSGSSATRNLLGLDFLKPLIHHSEPSYCSQGAEMTNTTTVTHKTYRHIYTFIHWDFFQIDQSLQYWWLGLNKTHVPRQSIFFFFFVLHRDSHTS